jgi:cytochrome P450 family 4
MVRSGNRIEAEALQSAKELVLDFRNLQDNVVNVVPVLQKATLTLIYRYLTHSNPPEKLLPPYLSAITQIRMILLAQSRSVWFLLPRWSYVWFSGLYRDEERVLEPIRQFSAQALQVAKPESPLSQLRAKSSHGSQQDLLDEAVTLLFAGQDTGAATLSWTLHLLSLHKDIQDRLAKEVRQPNNDLTKLPLLDAVIKESMRLYPVAPFVVRKCVQNILLSDTVTLPREALACIWIYSLHRNPDIWKDRPNSFVPERWLSGDLTKLERSAFMPFCAGPRNCLGQPMAHVWLRILLGTLIQTFEFIDERLESAGRHDTAEDPEDFYLDMQAGFTVLPAGGVNLRVRQR